MSTSNPQKGFTLIELVVAVFIFSILMTGVVVLVGSIFSRSKDQSLILSDVDQARRVTTNFTNELRNASYGNDGSYPINEASDNEIIFYSSAGGNGTVIERIRYYVSGSTLYKGVVVPTGSPLAYNLGSESVTAVQNDLGNGSIPVFYYYDGNYNGSGSALTQPVNVNGIKFVKINLMLQNKAGVTNTNTYPITAGVTIRNLKTNLGN